MIILRQKEFGNKENKAAKRNFELNHGGGDVNLGRFRFNSELLDSSSAKSASEHKNLIDYMKNSKLTSVHEETHGYMRGAHRDYNTKPSILTKIPFIGDKIKADEDARARKKLDEIITHRGGGPVVGHRRGVGIVKKTLARI